MRVSFGNKGGFDNATKWLNKVEQSNPVTTSRSIANEGVKSLSSNTPKDTGETSQGWFTEVKMDAKGVEIAWMNRAHPETNVNLAKLIDLGHGTRNGGYVSPRPYIKKSMDSILDTAGDKLAGELIK